MSFASLGLSDALVRAVHEHGYTEPTPIQRQAIPAVLAGGDLLAGAQTGTGKTAGFVLPLLQRLSTTAAPGRHARQPIRALILTPTRELAAQVEESVRVYGKYTRQSSLVLFGGVSLGPQTARLRRGVDIVVATPGRLLDHHGQGNIDLSRIEVLVLDEADRMLDMGFIRDIRRILALLPAKRQNLLFSATFSDEIRALADSLLDSPALIEVARRNSTVDAVTQTVHPVDRGRKRELLAHLIKTNGWFQVLVFTRTKHGANKLAEQLDRDGIPALAIHGNKSQGARTRALAQFKDASLQVLVATDIAARGIDIEELPHVVNFELPNVPEDYVHRIGRTGRAGATGDAVSLVCVDELAYLRDIEKLIRRSLPRVVVPGFEPDPHAVPQPILQRQGSGRPPEARTDAHRRHAGSGGQGARRPGSRDEQHSRGDRGHVTGKGARGNGPKPEAAPHDGGGRRERIAPRGAVPAAAPAAARKAGPAPHPKARPAAPAAALLAGAPSPRTATSRGDGGAAKPRVIDRSGAGRR